MVLRASAGGRCLSGPIRCSVRQGRGRGTAFQQLLQGETDKGMRLVEQDGLALALEAEGQVDKAIAAYAAMASEAQAVGNSMRTGPLFGKARLLQKQGKGKDAEKVLREILEKMPKTLLRREIDDRLAALGRPVASGSCRLCVDRRLLPACALSLSLVLSVHGCGSGALHRATEERHEYPAGVVQMRWRTVIHPYAASDAQPKNVPRVRWSVRVSFWARARVRWQHSTPGTDT